MLITKTLFFILLTISLSWVAIITVVPKSLLIFEITSIISLLVIGSKFPVGSSHINILGLLTIALAIATLCCSPPDNCAGKLSFLSDNPTFSNISFTSKAVYKYKFEKYEDLFTVKDNCKIITLRNTGIEAKTDPDGNNYDLDNSIIKICEEENNGLKEKVSYILIKSTTTETDKRVRGIFDNNSSDKTVKVDSLGTKDVLDLMDLK